MSDLLSPTGNTPCGLGEGGFWLKAPREAGHAKDTQWKLQCFVFSTSNMADRGTDFSVTMTVLGLISILHVLDVFTKSKNEWKGIFKPNKKSIKQLYCMKIPLASPIELLYSNTIWTTPSKVLGVVLDNQFRTTFSVHVTASVINISHYNFTNIHNSHSGAWLEIALMQLALLLANILLRTIAPNICSCVTCFQSTSSIRSAHCCGLCTGFLATIDL